MSLQVRLQTRFVDEDTGEILAPFVRPPWWRGALKTIIDGPSMTQQSHAESCDINNIVRTYDRTGVLPPATREAQYGDVTDLQGDLTERLLKAAQTIDTAKEWFDAQAKEAAAKAAVGEGTGGAGAPVAGATPPA